MSWSGLFNFVIGILLAAALLAGAGVVTARYLIVKLTAPPPKPIFPNDKPIAAPAATKKPIVSPTIQSETTPTPTLSPSPTLQPGTYKARVTQQVGLILRNEPSAASDRIGGIAYKEKVIVLEQSQDGEWQRVQVEGSSREGWVKAGNVERIEP
ncbi:hypothetical protein BST81_03665 [Leptolyngbya sp. 'hensonii']|uniref:SH3 domain-containing protein n=1 Tax=Leptolyngbya sp. 'hensonii' TaxID=1922337 RepID=UPI00094FC976|nr:SH3 domain-containing protein [Leptolyngbya sp. 'hensonii']OLP19650.1 hypothetical protein BST81_03665 [Leptolyngbya sp. 'hensonii']